MRPEPARSAERAPSAPTTSRAERGRPSARVRSAAASPRRHSAASLSNRVRPGVVRARARRLSTRRALSTFHPKASRPISPALNRAGRRPEQAAGVVDDVELGERRRVGRDVPPRPRGLRGSAPNRRGAPPCARPPRGRAARSAPWRCPSRARARAAASPAAPAPAPTATSNWGPGAGDAISGEVVLSDVVSSKVVTGMILARRCGRIRRPRGPGRIRPASR